MNLKFWKKKKAAEESDHGAMDETGDPAPAKTGFWARLRNTLSLSRKENKPDEAEEAKPSAKHKDEESEAPPPKPGFLARLKSALLPSRKKKKVEDEEKSEKPKHSAKHTDKKHRDKEPEPADIPAKKPGKRLTIVLALLIPLAAGGGFFAANIFMPQQHQKTLAAKDEAMQGVKVDGQSEPEPAEAAAQALKQESEQPPAEPAPQQADNAATPAEEVPAPLAEAPVADAPTPDDEDVQAQIDTLKKQNQEMQAQIEALKKQPAIFAKPPAPATTPKDGVLIINGKNAKESAQGLKKVIESMNADSDAKNTGRK